MSDNLTEKGKRDLKLINRALDTGDPKDYNQLIKYLFNCYERKK